MQLYGVSCHKTFFSSLELLLFCNHLCSCMTKYQKRVFFQQFVKLLPILSHALGHICAISHAGLPCKHPECTSLFFMFLSKVLLCGWCQQNSATMTILISLYPFFLCFIMGLWIVWHKDRLLFFLYSSALTQTTFSRHCNSILLSVVNRSNLIQS